ncbi:MULTISPECIES: hypothetical protein [unclassified Bradyrhizobium]|uniref:hypothetical protein n=1 Tax=unclassified Bradyrhizobium TaxID=2631580 RepID=UPI001BAD7E4E|nr:MULTISPECIES: hypothetical protein [unclassified Bradyrhizobium]MBR1203032.1 hypothetical protein [Bradyrhizobium sp. AUGA SZCCT0124]MBR1312695.1 hypothetical protein [Bradyrhizobium sp. AUGA SZCCT0051]MBR1341053.1 hypothetical protein [Bradyrhizobium sp. AUGA SZCCT0105]MBR1357009.1 hypothetical protein [Bradyrhizobium sp. AUGA SZCCT0045]
MNAATLPCAMASYIAIEELRFVCKPVQREPTRYSVIHNFEALLPPTHGEQVGDLARAHDIMAALGHTTLAEAERYTREADRRRGGKRVVTRLNEHRLNRVSQTASDDLGKEEKIREKQCRNFPIGAP